MNAFSYTAKEDRYDKISYRRCGKSGIMLPSISLGLWQNFGFDTPFQTVRNIIHTAFDNGVTHFDLANNYGTPFGSAEENFGMMMKHDLKNYRDELLISSKAGYDMWPGPYGNHGSRKYLVSSCDQSLKRMNLDYVDVFYHHRPDNDTPLEETMQALDFIVKSGRALYAGISNYNPEQTKKAIAILKDLGTPFIIHQAKYSMFVRTPEEGLLDLLGEENIGAIVFSPLAQGLLTDKYLKGIPKNSRIDKPIGSLTKNNIDDITLNRISLLNDFAKQRNQSLAQMAISWLLKDDRVSSVLVGASSTDQLKNSLASLDNLKFTSDEINEIERILKQ